MEKLESNIKDLLEPNHYHSDEYTLTNIYDILGADGKLPLVAIKTLYEENSFE